MMKTKIQLSSFYELRFRVVPKVVRTIRVELPAPVAWPEANSAGHKTAARQERLALLLCRLPSH